MRLNGTEEKPGVEGSRTSAWGREGRGRLLGNFPGQRREVLGEEVPSRAPLFAVGGYMGWNKQTQERLVTPSWQF